MNIISIEGIGNVYAKKLEKANIRTVEGLLQKGATAKGRKEISEETGIDETLILEWTNRADLFRIKGVGEQYSDLLEKAGVDTVVELSKRVPANLLAKMDEVNKRYNCVNAMPNLKKVEDWVKQAKELPRMVKY